MAGEKVCLCGEPLPDGRLKYCCDRCARRYTRRRWRATEKGATYEKAGNKAYYAANREQMLGKSRKYAQENRKKRNAHQRAYKCRMQSKRMALEFSLLSAMLGISALPLPE